MPNRSVSFAASATVLLMSIGFVLPARAQEAADQATKWSLQLFGDYYWVAESHDPEIEGRNGFWFRRIYVTADRSLSERLSARLRFEGVHPGDFQSNLSIEPFVKDAWIKWRQSDSLEVVLGISPTPTWDSIEQFWGYRAVEKTALDLQRMGSSRDFGISLLGRLGPGVRYHVMAGNGSSTRTETNSGKQVLALIGFEPMPALTVELYADHDDRPGETDRTILQAFAGWQGASYRIGAHYARQNRGLDSGGEIDLDIASIFAVYDFRANVSAILRVDRMFDPNPEAAAIPYVPFSPDAGSTLLIAGVDFKLRPRFGLIPNVEWITYDETNGTAPDDEIVPRLTFYYSF